MPKNKGKGGKNRRRGKNENDVMKRELQIKEAGQEYAQVLKMLGNGRLTAFCFDGKQRLCHIRGKLRKKVWINTGDIILLGLRDYQDDKADVILKFNPDEARQLKAQGELPDNAKINENDDQDEGDVEFTDMGAGSDEELQANDDYNMPSSGSSDEDEDEDEEEEEKKAGAESSDESDDDSGVNEEDLARGKGLKQPQGKDKYGKYRR